MAIAVRALALAALLPLAGCAGGEVPMAAAPAAAPVATAVAVAAKVQAPPVSVPIVNFRFRPRTLRIVQGARVTWTNRDEANHTVTFKRGPGDLGNLDEGQSATARFPHKGRYRYVCVLHPAMRGTIIVG